MPNYSTLDLVRHNGEEFIVVSSAAAVTTLTSPNWPAEFSEIEDAGIIETVSISTADIIMIEPAADRLAKFNAHLITIGDNADRNESWDWSDVSMLLQEATSILPRNLLAIDLDQERWALVAEIDDDLATLARPAAQIIASHAVNLGEADVSDLAEALDSARNLVAPTPHP